MIYRAIGMMSGSSLDGLDIACVEFEQVSGKWHFTVLAAECHPYSNEWVERLRDATRLPARDYLLLHSAYGHYMGEAVNQFIREKDLQFKVQLIVSHGHTAFHVPESKMTAQLGDGAAIAAATGIHTVSDLRAMDVALGGQGAPVVPIGDQLLWPGYDYYLNLGGIANITWYVNGHPIAFDVCPANRVLNSLAASEGQSMDRGGMKAGSGNVNGKLLEQLNGFAYYQLPPPKSLANEFGSEQLYPLIKQSVGSVADGLRTYVEHIALQVSNAVGHHRKQVSDGNASRMLATGGGAHNSFLVECIRAHLNQYGVELLVPDVQTVDYKEAIVMAFMGVLRWREENNVYASVTGASRDSAGGAFWLGH